MPPKKNKKQTKKEKEEADFDRAEAKLIEKIIDLNTDDKEEVLFQVKNI